MTPATRPAAPLDEALAAPRWTRPQRLMVGVVAVGVLSVLVVLTISVRTLWQLEADLTASEDAAEQFVAVMRESGQLEADLLRSGTFDDDEVRTRVGVLDRHVQVLRALTEPGVATLADTSDVAAIAELYGMVKQMQLGGSTDLDTVTELLSRIELHAKESADRAETRRRGVLEGQIDAAQAITLRTLAITVVVVLLSVVLLTSVRRRFRSAYALAHATAVARAEELARSNDELRAANDTKQRFVSMVSHELRTPLTVIRGFAETLAAHSDRLTAAQRDDLAAAIVRQALRQQRMVEDLLVVARHAEQAPTPVPEPLSVHRLVDRVTMELLADVPPGLTVEAGPDALVWVDPLHAEQVLENLLTNAGKYGGSRTWVRWRTGRTGLVLTVEDDGPGVPEPFVESLFDPFSQADSGDTRASRGVGLGLTITQTLVLANGGRISYRHRDGGGAHFEVQLPLVDDRQVRAHDGWRDGTTDAMADVIADGRTDAIADGTTEAKVDAEERR